MKPTCDLHDALKDAVEVLPPELISFGGRAAFHGRAATVRCFEDNSRIREAVAQDGRGRVLVVDAAGSLRHAVMGDRVAAEAAANGWEGVIVWGAIRDVAAMRTLDLGVLALGRTPRAPVRRDEGQAGIPVTIGGVRVAPGAYVVADEDGALVLPPDLPPPSDD
jgi:regulator of ribonuclease activity A